MVKCWGIINKMSANLDWSSLEGLEPRKPIAQPQLQNQQADWSSLEGLPGYEARAIPREEDALKSTARAVVQPIIGAAEFTTPGMLAGAWQLLGTGEALSEMQDWEYGDREEELRKKFPAAPWPEKKVFNKEKYLQALSAASKTVPTVSNIASFLEEQTSLPLEARTKLQKKLRLAGSAVKLRPGGLAEKVAAGTAAAGMSEGLQALGVPESIADIAGLGVSTGVPLPKAEKVIKPSGMPTRWYESIKKETKLTAGQYSKVKEAIESDVKGLTDSLIKTESKTARAIEEFPDFNEKLNNAFDRVSELAEGIEETVPNIKIKGSYRRKINSRETKGISPDEFERIYLKESRKLYKTIPDYKDASVKELVDQYRKNNKSFGELYEPGKSSAANRSKREALLDYNRAIEDVFNSKYPDSEFNKLFKFTNKRYMERMDLESIDGFFNKVFADKVNYKQARKFFDNPRVKNSFKRTLGEEGYKDMESIMKDFMSTEQSMKLIKQADAAGFGNIVKYAKKWALSPLWAKGAAIKDLAVSARNELLSKPKFRITWKSALNDFKAGNFAKAETKFKQLDAMESAVKNQ